MNPDEIHDLAERLVTTRQQAVEAEQSAKGFWDQAGAIDQRLREALHGNHHVILLHRHRKVLIIGDESVSIEDVVILDPPAEPEAGATVDAPCPTPPAPVTADQVGELLQEVLRRAGAKQAKAILTEHGKAARLSLVDPARLPALAAALTAALGAADAGKEG
jgi:hypothetical protein